MVMETLKPPAWIRPHQARWGMVIASLVGLFASAYLFYTYVSGAPIVCGLVSGCEAVRASRWAYTFGIPRPFLGLLFYTGVFGLLVARVATTWRPRLLYRLTMIAAVLGFVESAFLFLIQWLDVKAFCLWCLSSAIAATVILLLAPFDRLEHERHISANRELKHYFISLLIFLPIAFIGFVILLDGHKREPLQTTFQATSTASNVTPESILLGPDTPVEGPASSTVLVVEFGDFQCPACGAFYPTMKKIRENYRGRIRFAFRQFPLVEIHDRGLDAAAASVCAKKQNKFFPYADYLYEHQDDLSNEALIKDAGTVGLNVSMFQLCFNDKTLRPAIMQERAAGIAIGVEVTPTIFVNNLKINQAISYNELSTLIDTALTK